MADIKKIMTTAAANIKAVFGVAKANIKKVGSGGVMPAAGGGTFKEQMAALGAGPTYEFLFDAVDGSGDLVNTGTIGSSANATRGGSTLSVSPTSDEFDGECIITGNYSNWTTSVLQNTVSATTDRSWVFVWENNPSGMAWNIGLLSFAAWTTTAFGEIKTNTAGNYFWTQGGVASNPNFCATVAGCPSYAPWHASQTLGGSPQPLTGDAGLRTALIITYETGVTPGTEFVFRWKQDGDPAGHTFLTTAQSATPSTPTTPVAVKWAGHTGQSQSGANFRYVAVVDHVITESEADGLFTAAAL